MIGDGMGVAGFKGLKREALLALKKSQPLTAQELAQTFRVTANGIRRHLKELEAAGFVTYERVIRGVGGPMYAYRLTPSGQRLFPTSYDLVLSQALETVRDKFGSDAVVEIFRERWAHVAEQAKPELAALPLHERTERLAVLLSSMGYMAEATRVDGTLREHNCTIRAVVDRFPEICAAEERFIEDVLGADVTRQAHIAKGANCCEYCITERAAPTVVAIGHATSHTNGPQEAT